MENTDLKLVIALAKSYDLLFMNIANQVNSFGISLSEFGVLEMLYHKGKQPVQKIAERILVTSGTMTYVINQLIKKQYVVRKKCLEDKRIVYVELSEMGLQKIESVFPIHQKYVESLFSSMRHETKVELIGGLKMLQETIHIHQGCVVND